MAQDKPVVYRAVRCRLCGLTFKTAFPKGSIQCPRECLPGSKGEHIEELEYEYREPETPGEYGKGETVKPQTMGSSSDERDDRLRTMYKFRKQKRRWY